MKFGKRLRIQTSDTLPEWSDKFISYKQLKKRLKTLSAPTPQTLVAYGVTSEDSKYSQSLSVSAAPCVALQRRTVEDKFEGDSYEEGWGRVDHSLVRDSPRSESQCAGNPGEGCKYRRGISDGDASEDSLDEGRKSATPVITGVNRGMTLACRREFIRLLNAELEKFNDFFMEKEEEYVIRLQFFVERINAIEAGQRLAVGPTCPPALAALRQDLVDFMGEMVLLLNYSNLNYLGLVKILKKHDKQMLTNLRLPFITTIRRQPFTTTGLLKNLVMQCEQTLQAILPPPPRDGVGAGDGGPAAVAPETGVTERNLASSPPPSATTSSLTGTADSAGASRALAESTKAEGEDGTPIYRSALAALKMITAMMPIEQLGGTLLEDGCRS